jgi:uncharacterized membrane protein
MLQETLSTEAAPGVFRVRGTEISRLEGFSDVVFGFALTLIVVSLEVPRSYDELIEVIGRFGSFAACFWILMWFWYEHHKFFRYYALQDKRTIVLNGILLFVVLFYLYPLKFLLNVQVNSPDRGISNEQAVPLLVMFSVGWTMVFLVFMLLYKHAYKRREHLGLHQFEIFDTRTSMLIHGINAAVGAFAGIAALAFPASRVVFIAVIAYVVVLPAAKIFCMRHRNKMRRKLVIS